jgi:hypothetical protein
MSYHEIQVLPSYNLKCRQCEYTGWARTAGIAEQQATEHIEFESGRDGTLSNYYHHVEIAAVTIVGRNL